MKESSHGPPGSEYLPPEVRRMYEMGHGLGVSKGWADGFQGGAVAGLMVGVPLGWWLRRRLR